MPVGQFLNDLLAKVFGGMIHEASNAPKTIKLLSNSIRMPARPL